MKDFFYTITESMLDLGLRGTELPLFAVIYGYSQRGGGCCYMKQDELAKWCGVATRQTINHTINSLIEKGLIRKFSINKDGKNIVAYAYTGSVKNFDTKCKEFLQQDVKKIDTESKEFLHKNNIIENIKDNKSPFIPPTPLEVSSYARQRGFIDPDGFAFHFCDYYSNGDTPWHLANGKPMKDWKRAVITWEPSSKERKFHSPTSVAKRITKDAFFNSINNL